MEANIKIRLGKKVIISSLLSVLSVVLSSKVLSFFSSLSKDFLSSSAYWGIIVPLLCLDTYLILYCIVSWGLFFINKSRINHCRLQVKSDSIIINSQKGEKIFTPADIYEISIKKSFFDTVFGGKTIFIKSTDKAINIHAVQNANDIVDAIIELKKQLLVSTIHPSSSSNDTTALMNNLKTLLDSGVLSQEEYEEKKQELLAKL